MILRFLVMNLITLLSTAWAFNDLEQSQYPEALLFLQEREVIRGYPDGTFRPYQTVTRAELVSLLLPASQAQQITCFKDLESLWYSNAVCEAKSLGLVTGYSDGTFRPDQSVSYAEALKLVLRVYQIPIRGEADTWYRPYQQTAHNLALLSQYSYFPQALISRDAVANLLYKTILTREGQRLTFYSTACGTSPSVPPQHLEVNGMMRNIMVSLPENYNPAQAYPLVIAFHGRTNSNTQVRRYFNLEPSLEAIIVYPAGIEENGHYSWSDAGDSSDSLRDYTFFDAIVELIQNSYCVDTDRIFVIGHSLGAWFANSLACARGDIIRALASVAGGISPSNCGGPVAALLLHHPEDNLVPITEGERARDTFLSQDVLSNLQGTEGEILQSFSCQRYALGLHPVLWCPHGFGTDYSGDYYPHLWPRNTVQAIAYFFATLP
jgi:polyhydroxybutyrate depolymerase